MPTVFGLDLFQADIQADFTANNVTAELLIGTWNAEVHYGAPRVVIGRSRFKIEDPTGDAFGANGWIDLGDGTAARALLHRAQTFAFWVHSVAPAGTAPLANAIAARQATDALLDATLAAIRRTRGGMILGWTDGEPLEEERGDFVYGSIVTFGVVIYVPVYDTPTPVAQAGEVEADAQITIDGVDTPATAEVTDTTM